MAAPSQMMVLVLALILASGSSSPAVARKIPRTLRMLELRGHATKPVGHDLRPTDGVASTDFGDLTCMRWTGGTCAFSSCLSSRGQTECTHGKCLCLPGHCANAEGVCEKQTGKWLGKHAIRFLHPFVPKKPYVAVHKGTLSITSDPGPFWRVALTSRGHVRFATDDNQVLTIYSNRRRRSTNSALQTRAMGAELPHQHENRNETAPAGAHPMALHKISDDDDLWPMLQPFDDSDPLEATFLVHHEADGLEIWDPQNGVALASADPDWWIEDSAADRGVAECYPSTLVSGDCDGRNAIVFEPALPEEAVTSEARIMIRQLTGLATWQYLLVGFALLCCCCCGGACCKYRSELHH